MARPARGRVTDWVQQASNYAAMGISIIPVARKVAAIKWEPWQRGIMPAAEIERYFRSPAVTGIAVVLGPVSGDLACRDFDAADSYDAWKSHYPEEANRLPTVKTPRGFHVYFRQPGIRTRHLGDGELRGASAYCLLPSSIYRGKVYRWLKPFGGEFHTINRERAGLSQPWNGLKREDRETDAVGVGRFSKKTIATLEQAINLAVPSGPGQNHQRLFVLARGLLAVQHHIGRNLTEQERMAAFALWYKQAAPYLRLGQSYDEYLMEFLEARERARIPLGDSEVIREAWQAASVSQPPATARKKLSDPRLLLLASFCRELQRRAGAQPFYLACRTVQERFNLQSHVTGYNWLMGLVRLKILEIAERGTRGLKGRATRFRYLPPLDD